MKLLFFLMLVFSGCGDDCDDVKKAQSIGWRGHPIECAIFLRSNCGYTLAACSDGQTYYCKKAVQIVGICHE